jgi:hypothetical protein
MYIPPYQQKKRKVTFHLIAASFLSILIFVGSIVYISAKSENMREECELQAQQKFNQLKEFLHDEMSAVQQPAENFVQHLYDTHFDFTDEESIYQSMEKLLEQNPNISGAIMAFEDWMYPQYADKNGFGPLIRRKEDGTTERLQVGESRDFRNQNEWYIRQKGNPNNLWSKPFLSDDGVIIVTYTIPLYDASGKFMGGFGIDIDLTQLSQKTENYKPFPTTTVVVIDEDLSIIMHPNPEYVVRRKLPDVMKRVGMEPDSETFQNARNSDSGIVYSELGPKKIVFFYGLVPGMHWKAILYCPVSAIYKPIDEMLATSTTTCGGLFVLSVFYLVYAIISYRKYKKSMTFICD